jgi:hypothetical protein
MTIDHPLFVDINLDDLTVAIVYASEMMPLKSWSYDFYGIRSKDVTLYQKLGILEQCITFRAKLSRSFVHQLMIGVNTWASFICHDLSSSDHHHRRELRFLVSFQLRPKNLIYKYE